MFDIGFSELVFIALLGLLVLGPKRLPEVARTAGRWVGKLRHFVANAKQDFDQQLNSEDLSELRKLKQELEEARRQIESTTHQAFSDVARDPGEKSSTPTAASTKPVAANLDKPPRLRTPNKSSPSRKSRKKPSARTRHGRARRVARRR